ncbi:zinc finger and BTB domain-containing protein 24-like [Anopheles bellator]|uniref:zinc finger and BTB domain-containing protein 24-like n=1 Tax=Anopheles bellator TaxID=139047 RepID=UPI002649B0F7|nr:zinc finger and BTB domain-containing protein 24-like [Anopheles bellator]
MCRVCLQNAETRSLFDCDSTTSQLRYADKIMKCSNMLIYENDSLPDRICLECIAELETAYRFRMNCDSSDAILQSYLTNKDCVESEPSTPKRLNGKQETITCNPDGTEEIAIPLDSGVLYTYKPPTGLNVKVIPRQKLTEDATDDRLKEGAANSGSLGDSWDAAMSHDSPADDPIVDHLDESETNTTDYSYERLLDSNDINILSAGDGNLQAEHHPGTGNDNEGYMGQDLNDIQVESPEPLPESENSLRTIRSIRKTNTPNEGKPTIETVMTQQAADGSGLETVIRVKRNLSTTKQTHLCKICNTTYKYKHALETHLRRHRGDRPYKCEHCEKAFVVPFELRRHVRTHTGQKPYKCRFCDRNYSDFGSKTKHERTHTGERPYKCEFCRKSFSYSHVLSSHLLTHTGVKKYCCTICGKRCTKSHHLKAHLNTHQNYANRKEESGVWINAQAAISPSSDAMLGGALPDCSITNSKTTTSAVILMDPVEQSLVESYVDTTRLGNWTASDDSLSDAPVTDAAHSNSLLSHGEVCTNAKETVAGVTSKTTVVTIGAEELGNVSIVSFGDYIIKGEDTLDSLIEGTTADATESVLLPRSGVVVNGLQDYVTVLLPKPEQSGLVDSSFGSIAMIDG